MTWFKVDDTLPMNAKVCAAGNAAMGLWVRAGAWCAQQLNGGLIPEHMAEAFGKPAEIRRLVEVRLWHKTDGGYQFHQWDDFQPSREKVLAERDASRERQRRAREKAKSRRDSDVTSVSVTVPPARPGPARPNNYSSIVTKDNARGALRVVNGGFVSTEAGDE